jgi:hypothetical protein
LKYKNSNLWSPAKTGTIMARKKAFERENGGKNYSNHVPTSIDAYTNEEV